MKTHNIVYKTTNLVNQKFYIGVHATNNLNDGYLGSGKLLKRAIKKYGIENFKREILFDFETLDEAYSKEGELVTSGFIENQDNYNLRTGGEGGTPSSASREKLKRRKNPWKGKSGEDIPWFGRPISEKRKNHLSETRMGDGNPMWGRRGALHVNFGNFKSEEQRSLEKQAKIARDSKFRERIEDVENCSKERGWQQRLAEKWRIHPRSVLMFVRRWCDEIDPRSCRCEQCNKPISIGGKFCRNCFYKNSLMKNIFVDLSDEEVFDLKNSFSVNALAKKFDVSWSCVSRNLKQRGL
jgi:group I intron endonuclease